MCANLYETYLIGPRNLRIWSDWKFQ